MSDEAKVIIFSWEAISPAKQQAFLKPLDGLARYSALR
jgi:hypothetical protein